MKRIKKIIVTTACIGVMSMANLVAFAGQTQFSKKLVDSNSYTHVASATASKYTDIAKLKITDIYKADGTASNYTKVYSKVSGGTAKLTYVGTWYDLTVPINARGAGKSIRLYCMGNDPSLDCKVSGWWNAQ